MEQTIIRFTRTSAVADVYASLRPGTDIAFLGGIIHYILEGGRWFHDYVLHYTATHLRRDSSAVGCVSRNINTRVCGAWNAPYAVPV